MIRAAGNFKDVESISDPANGTESGHRGPERGYQVVLGCRDVGAG